MSIDVNELFEELGQLPQVQLIHGLAGIGIYHRLLARRFNLLTEGNGAVRNSTGIQIGCTGGLAHIFPVIHNGHIQLPVLYNLQSILRFLPGFLHSNGLGEEICTHH